MCTTERFVRTSIPIPTYTHVYTDGTAHKMNAGIIPGSHFRGKVLISSGFGMGSKSKDHPRRIESSCPKIKLRERPKATKYLVQMDLYEGSEMGEEDKVLGYALDEH